MEQRSWKVMPSRKWKIVSLIFLLQGQTLFPATLPWLSTSGTVPNDGNVYEVTTDLVLDGALNVEGMFRIDSLGSLTVPENLILEISPTGTLRNESPSSIEVFGSVYNYNNINNGTGDNPGRIVVYHPGEFYLLGGNLLSGDVNSTFSVKSGGKLYNYYGTIDLAGKPQTLNIGLGGKFENVRGNNPGNFLLEEVGYPGSLGGNFSDGDTISLDQDMNIDYKWTITEISTINGNGHTIHFGPNGSIFLEGKTTSLLLNDVTLNNLSDVPLDCSDDTTTFSFRNCTCILDGDTSFTKGTMNIEGNLKLFGNNKLFIFESTRTSTLKENSQIDAIFTKLEFGSPNRRCLRMADQTAEIILQKSSIFATDETILEFGTISVYGFAEFRGFDTLNMQNISTMNVIGGIRRFGDVIVPD